MCWYAACANQEMWVGAKGARVADDTNARRASNIACMRSQRVQGISCFLKSPRRCLEISCRRPVARRFTLPRQQFHNSTDPALLAQNLDRYPSIVLRNRRPSIRPARTTATVTSSPRRLVRPALGSALLGVSDGSERRLLWVERFCREALVGCLERLGRVQPLDAASDGQSVPISGRILRAVWMAAH